MSPFAGSKALIESMALIALLTTSGAAQTVVPRDTQPDTAAQQPTASASAPPVAAPPAAAPPVAAPPVAAPPAAAPAPAAAVAPAPVDEVLAAACAAGGGVADDLLLVFFRPGTEPARQESVARAVGGMLAGTNAQGASYLKVPAAAAGGLNAVADRVILQAPVEGVGPAECPPAPPSPAAPAPDSSAAR